MSGPCRHVRLRYVSRTRGSQDGVVCTAWGWLKKWKARGLVEESFAGPPRYHRQWARKAA